MGASLAGLLVLSVLFTGVLVVSRTELRGNMLVSGSTNESAQREGHRARTEIDITAASGNHGNNSLTATVVNYGSTAIVDFSLMDVVVQYQTGVDSPVGLSYKTSGPLSTGEWTMVLDPTTDLFEPGIFNPGETMTVTAALAGAFSAGDTGTVTIGTPNGIIDTFTFTFKGFDWTLHSEISAIAGTNYYQVKNLTPADGVAATISSVFTAGQTGRIRPTANNGKFVFPLSGISQLRAATWSVTYRVKRDKADFGFVWFTNAFDVSIENVAGTHDGPNDAAALTDSTAAFVVDGILIGDTIQNTTDGSSGTVTAVTATTITAALSGGVENDWDAGDSYLRTAPTNSWRDLDLSPFIPSGATGVVVETVNTGTSSNYSAVLRGKEDTRNYMTNPSYEEIEAETHRWQTVKVDTNRMIQAYIESTAIDFRLLGYTLGPDPAYVIISGLTPEVTPNTANAWTTVDVSSYVDSDADGVILFIDSEEPTDEDYAIREAGSSESITNRELEEYGNTMYLVGLSDSGQFEALIDDLDVKIYLVGQTKGSVIYYALDVPVADPATGTWRELDSDDYGVDDAANGLIFHAVNDDSDNDYRMGFRHSDSADDWNNDIGNQTHFQAAVGLRDSDNKWDVDMQDTVVDLYLAGYTRLVRMDVHADVDVLIRRADGTIRATLATDVADSTDIAGANWQTLTSTFAFPGYTVIDQTDYLEIDLFAEATSNISAETVSVDFRIDDLTLDTTDQMSRAVG